MFFCRCYLMASDSRPSVKRWPWAKSEGPLSGECAQASHSRGVHTRTQVPASPGQWCGIEHTPKMDTPRAATTKTPSQTHCWLIHSPNTCPFSLPWLCDPRDAHLSPSSRRKSCLVGAKEVGPSRWSGADSGISLWPNSDEWNMRGSGLGRLLRKVFCAWRSKCFGGRRGERSLLPAHR